MSPTSPALPCVWAGECLPPDLTPGMTRLLRPTSDSHRGEPASHPRDKTRPGRRHPLVPIGFTESPPGTDGSCRRVSTGHGRLVPFSLFSGSVNNYGTKVYTGQFIHQMNPPYVKKSKHVPCFSSLHYIPLFRRRSKFTFRDTKRHKARYSRPLLNLPSGPVRSQARSLTGTEGRPENTRVPGLRPRVFSLLPTPTPQAPKQQKKDENRKTT